MPFSFPASLGPWKHRALELARKLVPAQHSAFPPTWPVDAETASQLTIHWPQRYHESGTEKWMGHLHQGLGRLATVVPTSIPQPVENLVLLELEWRGKRHPAVIDFADDKNFIEESALRAALVYFKMQYRAGGYGSERVVPGGYVNPAGDYYRYLHGLRALRDRGDELARYDVYGRFSLEFAADIRRRAVELLRGQHDFRYEGSLDVVRYSQSLREAARARICIDLPGNGDFCFRLVDYLGLGCFILSVRHGTVLPVPLEDGKHLVYVRDDLSDLVELCRNYLDRPDERRAIGVNAREYYDRYLHREQLAGYYVSQCLTRLQVAGS